ncbi:PTS sugar transporter subunit IIB [Clostridium sp. Marseille-Q2269]|uniref:PTS system mannose/fructose/N-acetylgalactosamine-transporter subunit IIB n=1 Tax=Clostridium sp. Marseille-Q2269 TaxID=2942205 RepID=UPI002073011C|nr:PTS sugar transporter subunit IIB [Clostridium sp. Marseille-Q2269]
MKNIVFTRIDDRLIHGQVMTAWVQITGSNEVVIVDDNVAKNSFMQMVMKSAMPNKIGLKVLSIDEAIKYLSSEESGNEKIFILVKVPQVILSLVSAGIPIKKLDVGGIGAKENRRTLYRNISASEEEKEALIELSNKGVEVFFQVTPDNTRVTLNSVIKEEE